MKLWRTDRRAARVFVAALAILLGAAKPDLACAQSAVSPARSFSTGGLTRVAGYIANEIRSGKIPGAILLIQQHGKPVVFENFGVRDVATELSMTADTIFRLYSMSKPITSVAAMMLVEDGKLRLEDPVSKFIPAFANMKVGVEKKDEAFATRCSRERQNPAVPAWSARSTITRALRRCS